MMIIKIILCLFVFQTHLNAQNIVISENNFENKLIVVNMNSFTTNKNTETINNTTVYEVVLNNQNDTTEKALNESNVTLKTKDSSNSITQNNQYASKILDVSKNIVLEYPILCNNRWVANDME